MLLPDVDGDGYISRDEMQSYLTAVFRVIYESDPTVSASVRISADVLAASTTELCFLDADQDEDGLISEEVSIAVVRVCGRCSVQRSDVCGRAAVCVYVCMYPDQEFIQYCSSRGVGSFLESDAVREQVVNIAAEPPSWVSLAEIKRITNLGKYSLDQVAALFDRQTNNDGMLTRTAFNSVFRRLMHRDSASET